MTTVAVLGTGKMGGAMARRLKQSGFDLILWNRTPQRAQSLNAGTVARTPMEAARQADVVLSILTGPDAVRDVYLGTDGVFEDAQGKVIVEMSTAGPAIVDELARAATAKGAQLLEAPVLGSVPAVESGTLTVLVGGPTDALERARPVLECLGEVHHVGDLGTAPRLKLIANSMLAVIATAAAELLAAGQGAGVDREQAFWILSRFAPLLKARENNFLRDRHEPALFTTRDMVKDLDLALDLYHRSARPSPLTALTRELFAEVAIKAPELDISAITRRYA
jgi:3-hydroxyisobutyrate dehydrogenase-like beta-hydroxyacid dehydrogenase